MKLKMMLILVFASLFLLTSLAQAQKLLCVSSQTLKGEETVKFLSGVEKAAKLLTSASKLQEMIGILNSEISSRISG